MTPSTAARSPHRLRWLKPLGVLALILLDLAAAGLIGLWLLLTNPLTDNVLPWRPFFNLWPFALLVSVAALVWQHRDPLAWWLAFGVGASPFVVTGLLMVLR